MCLLASTSIDVNQTNNLMPKREFVRYPVRRKWVYVVLVLVFFIITYYFSQIKPYILPVRNLTTPSFTPRTNIPMDHIALKKTRGGINKVIHQSWKTNEIPFLFKNMKQGWIDRHSEWQYHLWTDIENRELIKQHYPWFLSTFDSYTEGVMRADACRYFYMHRYGGLYIDLDMEPLKTTDELIIKFVPNERTEPVAFLGYLSDMYDHDENIPNAWMLSTPGHPFWLFCGMMMVKRATMGINGAENLTGPKMLTLAVEEYARTMSLISGKDYGSVLKGSTMIHDLQVLEPGLIYPVSWYHPKGLSEFCESFGKPALTDSIDKSVKDPEKCKQSLPNAYAITYWAHSWQ